MSYLVLGLVGALVLGGVAVLTVILLTRQPREES